MSDDLAFIRWPPGPVPEPLEPAEEAPRTKPLARAKITHILMYWYEPGLCWRVVAADARGETRGATERHRTRVAAQAAAGRLAKRTRAGTLLISDGGRIEKIDYKPRN